MERTGRESTHLLSAISALLRHRVLRVLLFAVPMLTGALAILIAAESNLALAIVLNAAAGIVISGGLLIAIGLVARQIADERVGLVQAAEQGFWHGRAQRLSIYDETGVHSDWYFRLRLQEEIERCERYGLQCSVLVIKPAGFHPDTELSMANSWFGDQVRRHLRRSDLLGALRNGTLVVLMPSTGRRATKTLQRRITAELSPGTVQFGSASFPEDGDSSTALLAAARDVAVGADEQGVA